MLQTLPTALENHGTPVMKLYPIIISLVMLLVTSISGPVWSATTEQEELKETLALFLRASYARDANEAYQYLSAADQSVKTSEEYLAENGNYSGFTLELSQRLAASIGLYGVDVFITGARATVTFNAVLPDANHSSLSSIVNGFNAELLDALDTDSQSTRLKQLDNLINKGNLEVIESNNEQWELIRENGEWRVFLNWADAIEVAFGSIVSEDLGWEFYPTRELVLAQPGQTIQMSYIAVNTGHATTTGKARHVVGAADIAEYLEIVACFCFLEQSLEVGESIELPLVFRVDYEVPESVDRFSVDYEFFLESDFPENEVS